MKELYFCFTCAVHDNNQIAPQDSAPAYTPNNHQQPPTNYDSQPVRHQQPPTTRVYIIRNGTVKSAVVAQPRTMVPNDPDIPDYICWSILNICCCCFVLGFIALIFSAITRESRAGRDVASARRYSHAALGLNIVATATGIIVGVIMMVRIATVANYWHSSCHYYMFLQIAVFLVIKNNLLLNLDDRLNAANFELIFYSFLTWFYSAKKIRYSGIRNVAWFRLHYK